MTSRQQEKERRRQERVAREQAEARAAARRKRIQMVIGGAVAALALAAVIIGALSITGNDEQEAAAGGDGGAAVQLPPQELTDVKAAAEAAGCELRTVAFHGAGHSDKEFKPSDYNSNPPTSGPHNATWYEDGIYEPGTTPKLGELVHTLEHGRINIQYREGVPDRTVQQLEALYEEMSDGYHLMLYQNTTGMEYEVAATAWTQLLGCPRMNDKVFDAIRTFRARYIDKGPERVP